MAKALYNSPITIVASQMISEINEEYDKKVLSAVWDLGIEIDKEQLIMALKQDRKRYDEAWECGYQAAKKEIEESHKEILEDLGYVLSRLDELRKKSNDLNEEEGV